MATVSDFIVVQANPVTLPHLGQGFQNGIVGFHDLTFKLPQGVAADAVLSMMVLTDRHLDSSIDVAFSLASGGFSWSAHFTSAVFQAMTWVVGVKPGSNTIRINVDKAGTIQGTENLGSLGGAGEFTLSNVVLWYHH